MTVPTFIDLVDFFYLFDEPPAFVGCLQIRRNEHPCSNAAINSRTHRPSKGTKNRNRFSKCPMQNVEYKKLGCKNYDTNLGNLKTTSFEPSCATSLEM